MILAAAVQRYASEYVAERTVSVVPLPSDDMKGRIIGREGRNIRALEAATGIDLIIDDTPEAVVISCFNPVRREIARLALTRLIADGRIHPTRIEEMVEKATEEVERQCQEAGEQAVFDLGIGRLHPELTQAGGQAEVPVEQRAEPAAALDRGRLPGRGHGRRAGLAGEGGPAGGAAARHRQGGRPGGRGRRTPRWGRRWPRKHGESPAVCHAIEAHHGDVPATDALDHIVDAANVLSGQRPGARREMLETYVQRLGDLEKIATSFAGRGEGVRHPGRAARCGCWSRTRRSATSRRALLSRDIARRVEAELAYPGQIRVAVVRETRATDYAK